MDETGELAKRKINDQNQYRSACAADRGMLTAEFWSCGGWANWRTPALAQRGGTVTMEKPQTQPLLNSGEGD